MTTPKENKDGQFIVVENGQRSSELMSEAKAKQEAAKRQSTNESKGDKRSDVSVKQNLFGTLVMLLVPAISLCL